MRVRLPRLTSVEVTLPCARFAEWKQQVATAIQLDPDREPGNVRQFVASNATILAPEAVHLDCDQAAREIGWTKDEFMSMLMVYGLMYLIRYGR